MNVRRHLQIVTSEGRPIEDTCYHRTRGLSRTDELGLDHAEELFLHLFRDLCGSLFAETGDGIAAAKAFIVAELGEADGDLMFSSTVDLVYAIRCTRKSDFTFMPSDCPVCSRHLSDQEQATVMLVRAARRGDDAALVQHANALTEGQLMIGVGLAAKMLGEQLRKRCGN
ncbi:MAG: hypothetical protein AB7E81_21090 [Hyphomicrobiaceae bacterium]